MATPVPGKRNVVVPDIGNPENLTRDERISRALHHRYSKRKLKLLPDETLFEHFIVVGVPPKETLKYKRESRSIPQLLYHYPKTKPIEGLRIAQFLFPDGVRAKACPQTGSHSALFEALYSKSHLKHPEDAHAFLLTTEEKDILYGVCITRQEPVNTLRKEYNIDTDLTSINELLDSDTIVVAQQSYCFISKFPFFKLHFDVLKQILGIQHMQVTRFQANLGGSSEIAQSTPPAAIADLLDKFYESKVPKPGNSIELQLTWTSDKTTFTRESTEEETNEFQRFGAALLLSLLPKEMILRIISAIMVEKRIVFVCPNMRILSAIVLSFVPLLRPFVYQSVFLPVIPQSLQVVYTAPVPFVIGATTTPKESELYDELLIVDINNKTFILPPKCVLPNLPGSKELCAKLDPPLKKLTKSFAANHHNGIPYDPTPDEYAQVAGMCSLIQSHVANLFQHFRNHCITDVSDPSHPVSVFIKENFVLIEFADSKEDQEFMRMFLETQLFFDFSDKQLRKKDEKRG